MRCPKCDFLHSPLPLLPFETVRGLNRKGGVTTTCICPDCIREYRILVADLVAEWDRESVLIASVEDVE